MSDVHLHYRSKRVRDLAWVIASPPMCGAPDDAFAEWVSAAQCREEAREHRAWLDELDREPSALDQFIDARPTRRLGHYFESLHSFWFQHSPFRELLAQNVAIRSAQNQTLGELDFVYRRDTTIHCEIAVKFYLRAGPGLAGYVGPSLRDRFDWKLKKLAHHQSRRLEAPETQRALSERSIETNEMRAEVRLKGVLFERFGTNNSRPEPVATDCLGGEWLTLEDLEKSEFPRSGWHVLDRLDWLSGPAPEAPSLSLDTLGTILRSRPRPRPAQVGCVVDGELVQRLFIVSAGFEAEAAELAGRSPT